VVLAVMSMGPVGISDAIGYTDASLAQRMIAADGTLLKPSKALTSIDSLLAGAGPEGEVYGTYCGGGGAVHAHTFVSFQLKALPATVPSPAAQTPPDWPPSPPFAVSPAGGLRRPAG
jgi:hypothetical protein